MQGHRLTGNSYDYYNATLKRELHKLETNQQYGRGITQVEKVVIMSEVKWCDKGDHAFSAKDPGRQHFTQTQTVKVHTGNSYGNPTYQDQKEVTEELDICGPCWSKTNPFSPDSGPAKPLAAVPDDENYLRGYRDAKAE